MLVSNTYKIFFLSHRYFFIFSDSTSYISYFLTLSVFSFYSSVSIFSLSINELIISFFILALLSPVFWYHCFWFQKIHIQLFLNYTTQLLTRSLLVRHNNQMSDQFLREHSNIHFNIVAQHSCNSIHGTQSKCIKRWKQSSAIKQLLETLLFLAIKMCIKNR